MQVLLEKSTAQVSTALLTPDPPPPLGCGGLLLAGQVPLVNSAGSQAGMPEAPLRGWGWDIEDVAVMV